MNGFNIVFNLIEPLDAMKCGEFLNYLRLLASLKELQSMRLVGWDCQ